MKRLTALIFRFRKSILIGTGLLTLFFGYQLLHLRINSDIVGYLPKDDPAVILFNQVGEVFSGNDLALVAVDCPDVFSAPALLHIKDLTDRLKALDGVSAVTSLTDVIDIRKGADGSVEVGKLIDPDHLPETPAQLAQVKTYTFGKEFYRGRIVSADSRSTLIVCRLKAGIDKVAATRAIRRTALEAKVPERLYFGGVPFLICELSDAIFNDLKALIPLVAILVMLTLYVSFRTGRGVLVPLVSVLISTIWTLGFMSWMRVPLSIVSDVIPVLLIAVGTAPTIHILSKYNEKPSRYGSTGEETQEAFQEVGWRVILTELTIILGFTSFIFGSYLTMIREFGIFTALGTLFVLIMSLLFVPALLSYLPSRRKAEIQPAETPRPRAAGGLMHRLSQFILNHEWAILITWLLVFGGAAFGIVRIERSVDIVGFFKPGKSIRQAEDLLVSKFGGSLPIQIRVQGDLQDPYVLKEMRRFEKYLDCLPHVANAQSVADSIAELNDVIDGNKTVPDQRDKVANLWFFLEGQEMLPQYASDDRQQGLIQAMVSTRDSHLTRNILDSLDAYIARVPREAVAIDAAVAAPSVREAAYRLQAARVADAMVWDAKQAALQSAPDSSRLADRLFREFLAPQLADAHLLRVNPGSVLQALGSEFPSAPGAALSAKLADDLKELNDGRIYLPAADYRRLAGSDAGEKSSVAFDYSGMPLIYNHLDNSLLSSQIQSFLIALIFIYLLLAIQLKSFSGGLIGLIPIVLTVFITFGLMGYLRIPLDVATVLVASIALGIGIDYAIHFCMRFKHYFRISGNLLDALDGTLKTTGKAIIINVISVTMGFITLIFADLIPLQRFGLLVALTMIGSGLASITLLPVLILITRAGFVGRWDNIEQRLRRRLAPKGGATIR